jgi:hypothetical protein
VGTLFALTGAGFVVSLGIVALAAVAVCVWLLPRCSGPRPGQLAARTGLLAGSQLVLLSAVLALVNSDMQFYGSWADLVGADPGVVRIADRSTAVRPPAPPVPPSHDALTRGLPAADGRLDALDVRGARSGISARVYVYTPPQYARDRRLRLPAVLFLGAPRELIGRRRLPQLMAQEIAAGRLRPMLAVVAPIGFGCVDAPGGTQGETFASQDLPAAIATAYRVAAAPGGWAVAGPGTRGPAGYCAALLAMRHSDRFGAAVFAATALAPPAGELYGGSRAIRDEYDPRWRIEHRPPPPISAGVVADDGFVARVRPPMRADALPATAGQGLPAMLGWLSGHLAPGSRP